MHSWQHAVEQILLVVTDKNARVLSVLGPDRGVGVTLLCQQIAESSSRSGAKTLLIDLTRPAVPGGQPGWVPGKDASEFIGTMPGGYSTLVANPSPATRSLFNNVESLRRTIEQVLPPYDALIIDLPPVLDQRDDEINPIAAARASDAVIMVCVAGRSIEPRVRKAISTLEAAGVQLGGTVLNDRHNPPLGMDVAASLRRKYRRFLPGSAWLARLAESSDFLNARY